MNSQINSLKAQYDEALDSWKTLIGDEGADEAETKANEIKAKLDKAVESQARFDKQQNEHKAKLDFRTERPSFSVVTSSKTEVKSLGTLVAESHKPGRRKFEAVEFSDFDIKATLASTGLTSLDQRPGIVLQGLQRQTVADLMPNGTTGEQVIKLVVENAFTNTAGMVAEDGEKPELAFSFDEEDFPVRKIAGILPVTDEMLADHPAMRSYIDQRGTYCILDREEKQLISGSGTGQELKGILNTDGVQSQAKGTLNYADAVHNAVTKIQSVAFDSPTGMIVNPIDWQRMALEKDANNQYYGPGPFTGAYGNGNPTGQTYWGLRVVVTTNCPAGTAIVGAFASQAQIFRRTGVTVDVSNSHADYFKFNRQAFRFEERLAFAVLRPASFCKVTGLTPA